MLHITPVHEDDRRALIEVINGNFTARQIKILRIKSDGTLGNHYHPYRQFFYMLEGSAAYTFADIHTDERCDMELKQGDCIIIDKEIAHRALHKKGNTMVEGNEESYTSAEVDDLKYIIEP